MSKLNNIKFSIITVSYNSEKTIEKTLKSVSCQEHLNIEHIIVDGNSNDSTLAIIKKHVDTNIKFISESDDGIYDAMNKGVALATGDVVAFLNSDDIYVDSKVISDVAHKFSQNNIQYVYGDIDLISKSGSVIRRWIVGSDCEVKLHGKQIPHPTFFVLRDTILSLETPFDSSYKISADLKQQLLIINKSGARGAYIPRILVNMMVGGASTGSLSSYLLGWKESVKAYNEVFESGGFTFTFRKVFSKINFYFFIHLFSLKFSKFK
jgi:glycosyltransferase